MPEESFKSVEELYLRLYPALRTKKREMQTEGLPKVEEQAIWHYLCKTIWQEKRNLTLHDMVDDILNTEYIKIYLGLRKEEEVYGANHSE